MICLLDQVIESSSCFILRKNLPCKDAVTLAPWFKAGHGAADDICKLYFPYVPGPGFRQCDAQCMVFHVSRKRIKI